MKKIISTLLAAMLAFGAIGAVAEEEDHTEWALAHGFVKAQTDVVSSATQTKVGGVNYGAIEWDTELQMAAVREFLKGGKYLGDAACAQDETGYNYREMYQMATCSGNIPSNTNLELVLDAADLHLLGVSEANTGKTIEFQKNPNVSVSWCRQLREVEEEKYNYYCSYGVQFNGVVKVYGAADLETEAGKAAVLNIFDKYYPTLASTWMGYSSKFAGLTDAAEIQNAKLGYISGLMASGSMVIYEIVPSSIVVTAPFLMNLVPQMSNAASFTTQQEGEDKYVYDLCLSDAFLDKLVAYKAAAIATDEGKAAVEAYYAGPMFQMLDGACAQYGMPTSLEYALNPACAAGLRTQTTYVPGN